MTEVPEIRVRPCNREEVRPDGDFVLYWMTAFRRLGWSFALERAAEEARRLGKPLVILEALRCGYRWANDRIHRFVLEGMADHAERLAGSDVLYHPYVEPEPGAGKGLVEALGRRACAVVADDYPAFFLPRMVAAAAAQVPVRMEAVDSNGLLPLAGGEQGLRDGRPFPAFSPEDAPRAPGAGSGRGAPGGAAAGAPQDAAGRDPETVAGRVDDLRGAARGRVARRAADRSLGAARRRGARWRWSREAGAGAVPGRAAGRVRGGAERSQGGSDERALSLSSFRVRLAAPDVRRRGRARAVDRRSGWPPGRPVPARDGGG